MEQELDFSYWAMYLKKYLRDIGDARQDDVAFINGRSDAAAAEFETARREGLSVHQAMERANRVLMEGFMD